jgi:hypothetical protein
MEKKVLKMGKILVKMEKVKNGENSRDFGENYSYDTLYQDDGDDEDNDNDDNVEWVAKE